MYNHLSTLTRNTFPKSLKTINLSNNKIKTIEEGTFENLKYLQKVDLRWNEIVFLDSSDVKLNKNIQIETIFFLFGNPIKCDCHLATFQNNTIHNYPTFSDLAAKQCFQHDIHYLETASLKATNKSQFVCTSKQNSLFNLAFPCYLNCQCCLTENCFCQEKCTENCMCTFRYDLTDFRINCQNGNLTEATSIPSYATMIDLSANDLGSLTNQSFVRQNNAEILYLNNSKITGIGKKTFITFSALKILHLENNEIRMLGYESLLGLNQLKELILNHNAIERILPGTFNMTPNLEVLDLSFNNLRKIDSHTLNSNNAKKIFLFGNPWSCDCHDIDTVWKFLINKPEQIDSKQVLCNGSETSIISYAYTLCWNKTSISRTEILNVNFVYIVSIGLPITIFVLGTIGLTWWHRREIQILLFTRYSLRIFFKKKTLDTANKKYDAFVSYHNSQDEFVVTKLLPQLEDTDPGFKLCVHFRDFPVGAPIVDNISESIENSKRTILLLTDEILQSEWCRYEFQAAHFEALSNKTNRLILVLPKDINMDLVNGRLKYYLKTKTYLRYDDPKFWDKLQFTLLDTK